MRRDFRKLAVLAAQAAGHPGAAATSPTRPVRGERAPSPRKGTRGEEALVQPREAVRSPARGQRPPGHRLAPLETTTTLEDARAETDANAKATGVPEVGADEAEEEASAASLLDADCVYSSKKMLNWLGLHGKARAGRGHAATDGQLDIDGNITADDGVTITNVNPAGGLQVKRGKEK